MASLSSATPPTFLTLPAEIRARVYGFVFKGSKIIRLPRCQWSEEEPNFYSLPRLSLSQNLSLSLTCKAIRAEVVLHVAAATTLVLGNVGGDQRLSAMLPQHFLNDIRHVLATVNIGSHPSDLGTDSLPSLKTLQFDNELHLVMVPDHELERDKMLVVPEEEFVKDVVEFYRGPWSTDSYQSTGQKLYQTQPRHFEVLSRVLVSIKGNQQFGPYDRISREKVSANWLTMVVLVNVDRERIVACMDVSEDEHGAAGKPGWLRITKTLGRAWPAPPSLDYLFRESYLQMRYMNVDQE